MVGILVVIWALLFSTFKDNDPYAWTYEDQENWKTETEECGKGPQSPIDIVRGDAQYDNNSAMFLTFKGYNENITTMKLNNKDNALYITGTWTSKPSVKFNNVVYEFEQINFHWGENIDVAGSEHTFDGERKVMEVQVQHKSEGAGLLVLAVPLEFQISGPMDVLGIRKSTDQLTTAATTQVVDLPALALTDFVPNATMWTDFYWYKGSLTMPPCSKDVHWCVAYVGMHINEPELTKFREIKMNANAQGKHLSGNIRSAHTIPNLILKHIKGPNGGDTGSNDDLAEESSKGSSVRESRQIRPTFYVTSMVILFVAI